MISGDGLYKRDVGVVVVDGVAAEVEDDVFGPIHFLQPAYEQIHTEVVGHFPVFVQNKVSVGDIFHTVAVTEM